MEDWRNFLNEGMHPKIKEQIKIFLEDKNLKIVIYNKSFDEPPSPSSNLTDVITFAYIRHFGRGTGFTPSEEGFVKIKPSEGGSCLQAWESVRSNVLGGMGPLLYEVAIEWVSQKRVGLYADRGSVSADAKKVWEKYLQRSEEEGDISTKQLDLTLNQAKETGLEQHTPDDKKDDCPVYVPKLSKLPFIKKFNHPWKKKKWKEDPLNKVYYKPTSEVMDALGNELFDNT
jgi:hypothetical protein